MFPEVRAWVTTMCLDASGNMFVCSDNVLGEAGRVLRGGDGDGLTQNWWDFTVTLPAVCPVSVPREIFLTTANGFFKAPTPNYHYQSPFLRVF